MAEKIKQLRASLGLSLEEVGNMVGVGKSTVRKWETGDIANMRRDKIAKLADALHTTPAYLMGWEDSPSGQAEAEAEGIYSVEALEVADAYDKADDKTRCIVRVALDLQACPDEVEKEPKPSNHQAG